MKTWIALVGAMGLCIAGLAQFSGSWEGNIHVLPTVAFDYSTITIIYTISGWKLTSTSKFTDSAFSTQSFEAAGTLGSIAVTAKGNFDPTLPSYKDAQVTGILDFAGLTITAGVHHWAAPYIPTGACEQTVSSYLEYTLQVTHDPITVKASFIDCCTGTTFDELNVSVSEISLCCDLTVDGEFEFSKANGFESVVFSLKNLILCPSCIALDISVTFTTEEKSISLTPKLDLPVDTCFTLYGDVDFNLDQYLLDGITIQGFAIRCELTDCSYLEIKTSLAPGALGFEEEEFEYSKLHVCGPACCGGDYTGEFTLYFGQNAGPFGLTRVHVQVQFPLLEGFTMKIDLDLPIGGDPALDLGWTFSF